MAGGDVGASASRTCACRHARVVLCSATQPSSRSAACALAHVLQQRQSPSISPPAAPSLHHPLNHPLRRALAPRTPRCGTAQCDPCPAAPSPCGGKRPAPAGEEGRQARHAAATGQTEIGCALAAALGQQQHARDSLTLSFAPQLHPFRPACLPPRMPPAPTASPGAPRSTCCSRDAPPPLLRSSCRRPCRSPLGAPPRPSCWAPPRASPHHPEACRPWRDACRGGVGVFGSSAHAAEG